MGKKSKIITIVCCLFIGAYIVTALLGKVLLERIEYLDIPKVLYKINVLYGALLFLYSGLNLRAKIEQYLKEKIELPDFIKRFNNRVLEIEKYVFQMYSIWLFFEVFCFAVCIFTIIRAQSQNLWDLGFRT